MRKAPDLLIANAFPQNTFSGTTEVSDYCDKLKQYLLPTFEGNTKVETVHFPLR